MLAQVGARVLYSVTVTNAGTEELRNVVVIDDVPPELNIYGVPVIDAADSINMITFGSTEQIIWSFDSIAPGRSIRLPWYADVVGSGDLAATNVVTASAGEAPVSSVSDLFLATAGNSRVVTGEPSDPPPAKTVRKRVVTYRAVPPSADVSDSGTAAHAGPDALPNTGIPSSGWLALAALVIGGGAALYLLGSRPKRHRFSAVLIAAVIALTACVTSGDDPSEVGELEDVGSQASVERRGTESDDQVLGERISRPEQDNDEDESASDEPAVATLTESPVEVPEEVEAVVSFEVVSITPEPPPVLTLGPLPSQNTVTFDWDEASRQVLSAASSQMVTAGPASLVTELATTSGPIRTVAVLTNESDSQVEVRGRLTLHVTGTTASTVLTSDPIDVVLEPGGVVTAPFTYLLPSGSYSISAVFAPS